MAEILRQAKVQTDVLNLLYMAANMHLMTLQVRTSKLAYSAFNTVVLALRTSMSTPC